MSLWTTVNIDTKPVVAELKGIRLVLEDILEFIQTPPPPPPDEAETQQQLDDAAGRLNQSSDILENAVNTRS